MIIIWESFSNRSQVVS